MLYGWTDWVVKVSFLALDNSCTPRLTLQDVEDGSRIGIDPKLFSSGELTAVSCVPARS